MLLLVALSSPSLAQEPTALRGSAPAASVAGADVAWAPFVSPALTAFDPDPRGGFFFAAQNGALNGFAMTTGRGGIGAGGTWLDPDGDGSGEGSIDANFAARFEDNVSIGTTIVTRFQDTGVTPTLDLGLAWRPTGGLGFAGVLHNVATHNPDFSPIASAGLVVRPWAGRTELGLDAVSDLATDQLWLRPTLHLWPTPGFHLFADLRQEVGLALSPTVGFGAAFTAFSLETGAATQVLNTTPNAVAFVALQDSDDSLIRPKETADIDLSSTPPYESRRSLLVRDTGLTWSETLSAVKRAAQDRSVKSLILRLDGAALSWARGKELRDGVLEVTAAGKPVTAWLGPNVGTGSYWIATAASKIAIDPAGQLDLTGGAIDLLHLRGLLDRIGVEAQMVRRSEYKSAPEQMSLNEPSAEALEQMEVLLDDVFDGIVADIANRRGRNADEVKAWIDEGPWPAKKAVEAGLIDELMWPDQLHDGETDLVAALASRPGHSGWTPDRAIAVVVIEGAIVDGDSRSGNFLGPRTSGADTVVRQLEEARTTDRIKAVVIRVDSPGGSASASDAIWRAVQRVKREKPVVVSMGGLAASGGYYVACGADEIFAEPQTITGSIGVFTTKISAGALFDKLGVTSTVIQRGRNADLNSTSHPWNADQREEMQSLVDSIYELFKERVAEGRRLEADVVEAAARGRVWSGTRAQQAGLVDKLGGLPDAVMAARARAGISDKREVALVSLREDGRMVDLLTPELITATATQPLEALMRPLGPALLLATHPEVSVWALDPTWLVQEVR